jgi:aspartyl-tRNA(Asn)/glutamyl-tRNA(Gln) amidotransferase subunit C
MDRGDVLAGPLALILSRALIANQTETLPARRADGGVADDLLHSAPVKISADQIRHVALLARLALTPAEEAELTTTLDQILQHMDQLNRLDTDAVEPTAHVVAIDTPWREDAVTNAADTEALLANAPARDDDLFLVPKIID